MNKNKIILVAIFLSLISLSDVSIEVDSGINTSIGIDGINKISPSLPDIIKFTRNIHGEKKEINEDDEYKKPRKDPYTRQLEGEEAPKANPSLFPKLFDGILSLALPVTARSRKEENLTQYTPKDSFLKKSLFIAQKSIIKAVHREKYLKFSVKEDITGIFARARLTTKNFIDPKYENINLNLGIDNKYIYANVGFDVYDKLKRNEDIKYDIRFNPLSDYSSSTSLLINGKNKSFDVNLNYNYKKDGFYFAIGPNFKIGKNPTKIVDEIDKVKYMAPGKKEIEYLKKYENLTENGLDRLNGIRSGSLYGESLLNYLVNEAFKSIEEKSGLKFLSDFLKDVDKIKDRGGSQELFDAITKHIIGDGNIILNLDNDKQKELQKKAEKAVEELNKTLIKDLNKKFLEKLGIDNGSKKDYWIFDYFPWDLGGKNPDFFDLLLNYKPDKNTDEKPKPDKNTRSVIDDLKKYTGDRIRSRYDYLFNLYDENVINYKKGNDEQEAGRGIKIMWYLGQDRRALIRMIQDPSSVPQLKLLSLLYLHQSEYDYNKELLEKKVEEYKKDKDVTELDGKTHSISPSLIIASGYRKNNFSIDTRFDLFNIDEVKTDSSRYRKIENKADINLNYENNLVLKTENSLNYSKILLKTSKLDFNYNNLDILSNNYLGYRFNVKNKRIVELGLGNSGKFSYIHPITMKYDNKYITQEVLKRKNGNPLINDIEYAPNSKTQDEWIKEALEKKFKDKPEIVGRNIRAKDAFDKENNILTSGWYNISNVIEPRISITEIPNRNIQISNELKLPISFIGYNLDGFNLAYNTNIKYIFGGKDFNLFNIIKENGYNFSGNIFAGLSYKTPKEVGNIVKAKIKSDVLDIDFNADSLNIDFRAELNPSILNLPLRPLVAFEKSNDKEFLSYGLSLNAKNHSLSFIYDKRDDLKINILNDLDDVYKARVGHSDYNTFTTMLKDKYSNGFTFGKKYIPHIRLGYNSKQLTANNDFSAYSLHYKNGDNIEINRKVMSLESEFNYEKDYGFSIGAKLDAKYLQTNVVEGSKLVFDYSIVKMKLYNRISYTNRIKRFILGLAVDNEFDLEFKKVDNSEKLNLYGSTLLKYKDVLSPQLILGYKISKNLSFDTNSKVNVHFNNKVYEKTDFNFTSGLKYKW